MFAEWITSQRDSGYGCFLRAARFFTRLNMNLCLNTKLKKNSHLCLATIEKSHPCPIRNNNRVKQTHKQKIPNQKSPQKLPVTLLSLPRGKLQWGNFPVGAEQRLEQLPQLSSLLAVCVQRAGVPTTVAVKNPPSLY